MYKRQPFCLLPLLASGSPAQGAIWVVDDDGGPGVDFTDIQPAVDAAAPGDGVLVKDGVYLPFTIAGKGLSVVADEADDALVEGPAGAITTRVIGVPAGQRVLIRGLRFRLGTDIDDDHLRFETSPGGIWLEDVQLESALPFPFGVAFTQRQALRVESCDEVVLTRCVVSGVTGAVPGMGSEIGSIGLSAVDSTLHLYDTLIGAGGSTVLGGEGTEGVELVNSFASLRACSVFGGSGGEGGLFGPPSAGAGGPAVLLTTGAELWSIGTDLVGGAGGAAFFGTPGPDGPPFEAAADSAVVEHAASNVAFTAPAVVCDCEMKKITYPVSTDPDSLLILIASFEPEPVFVPSFPDTVAVGLGPILLTLGTTDAAGDFSFVFGTPFLPPALDFFQYTIQIAALTPSTGLEFSNPTLLTLVQDGL